MVTVAKWPDEAFSPEVIRQAVETFRFDPKDPERLLSQSLACLVFEGLNRYRSCQVVYARWAKCEEVDELLPLAWHLARAHDTTDIATAAHNQHQSWPARSATHCTDSGVDSRSPQGRQTPPAEQPLQR